MPERESTSVPCPREARSGLGWLVLVVCVFCSIAIQARAGEGGVVSEFEARIKPLLEEYCYDCHDLIVMIIT